jgi:hypothetical protein
MLVECLCKSCLVAALMPTIHDHDEDKSLYAATALRCGIHVLQEDRAWRNMAERLKGIE